MKKMNLISKGLGVLTLSLSAFALTSCLGDGDETIVLESENKEGILGIPDDSKAGEAPAVDEPTTTLPNPQHTVQTENGYAVMNLDMTGVWDAANSDWMKLYGTAYKGKGQNIWISVDGQPKGIDVYNNSENEGRAILVDLVFLVDNSGSMSEEAEAIARDIKDWAEKLTASGLDIRFGCVGYGDSYHAIDGALNITTVDKLKEYLDGSGTGTYRTHYYGGEDAAVLRNRAEGGSYENGSYNECGMVALHFANDNFAFRSGANRIYVNFTDEPNQPSGISKWSVEYLNPNNSPLLWNPANGTVHTVYSESPSSYYWSDLYKEKPWLMSEYTGGSVLYTTSRFTDWETGEAVTLESLPVTGAMANSYIIRFTNIEEYMDGQPHEVKITVVSEDGTVQAEKTIWVIFAPAGE